MSEVIESPRLSTPSPSLAPPPSPSSERGPRLFYLDRLKLTLVAVIIFGHGVFAYGDLENAWPYQAVQEVHLGAVSNVVVNVIAVPIAMFAMGLFFLLSGMVVPGSLVRRGAGPYARSRLLRLGAPLLVWTLLLWPGSVGLAHLAAGDGHPPWWQLLHDSPTLDTGPMWFVLVLLIFSLAYVGRSVWRSGERPSAAGRPARSIRSADLARIALAISLLNLLVRPIFPAAGAEFLNIHLWQWPQCLVLFLLGTVAAGCGWLGEVPAAVRRRAGRLALAGLAAFVLVVLLMAATNTDGEAIFETGFHWPALALAAIEGPLAVGASVWLLGFAQRRLARPPGRRGVRLARSAYGAFVLQGVVLIGLMIAMRPVGLPAEIKALVVASLGVAGSFAGAWLLVSRTPLGKVL